MASGPRTPWRAFFELRASFRRPPARSSTHPNPKRALRSGAARLAPVTAVGKHGPRACRAARRPGQAAEGVYAIERAHRHARTPAAREREDIEVMRGLRVTEHKLHRLGNGVDQWPRYTPIGSTPDGWPSFGAPSCRAGRHRLTVFGRLVWRRATARYSRPRVGSLGLPASKSS